MWPLYLAALRARYRCPCCLLVVTPAQRVAQWAAQAVALGPMGNTFRPLVLGPESVPRLTEAEQARAAPELALLSVQAHGETSAGFEVAMAAMAGVAELDDEQAMLYCEWIHLAVSERVRQQLEEAMRIQDYEFRSEFAVRYLTQGRAQGRLQGQARSVLRILEVRQLAVSGAERAQILDCTDPEQLDRWIERAVTVQNVAELFH